MKKSLFFLSILVSIPIAGLKAQTISTEYVTPVVEGTVANPVPDGWMPIYGAPDKTLTPTWIEKSSLASNPMPDGWMPVYSGQGDSAPIGWVEFKDGAPVRPVPDGWMPVYSTGDLLAPANWFEIKQPVEATAESDPTIAPTDTSSDSTVTVTEYTEPVLDATIANPVPDGWMPIYSAPDTSLTPVWKQISPDTTSNPIPDGWMPVYSVADLTKQSGWIEIQYGQPVTNPIPDGWMPLFDAAGVQSVKNWIQIGTY